MSKGVRLLLIAFVAGLALSEPASAGGIAKYAQPQPGAPIQISNCNGGIEFTSDRWGTSSSTLNTGVDFKNTSSKTAVAIMFRMQLSNAFGDLMDNRFGQATGEFSAGAAVAGNHWSEPDIWPGLGEIACSVNRVRFSDGTIWSDAKPQDASPSPQAAQ